jgi:flagellar motility protein MotE (MotC chaperone)
VAKPVADVSAASETGSSPRSTSVSEQFCTGILDRAADFRLSQQRAELARLQKTIEERLRQLELKRTEFETWIKRREDFLSMVQGNLSAIYTKMKPAAAAEQLTKIDDMTAAAILLKLDPRATSAILTEMDPTRAADLARLFAAAGRNKFGKGS